MWRMLKVEIGAEAEICNMSAVRLPPPLMCRADHDGGGELAKKTKIESGEPSLPALTSVPDSGSSESGAPSSLHRLYPYPSP